MKEKFIDIYGNWHLVLTYYYMHGDYYIIPTLKVGIVKDLYYLGIVFLRYNLELNLFNSADRRQ